MVEGWPLWAGRSASTGCRSSSSGGCRTDVPARHPPGNTNAGARRPARHNEQVLADRWGVTEEETRRRFPCDDLVDDPALEVWRGVDVAASADAVWPWVTQVRVAPYSYDWVDNLGRRSPQLLLDLPEPRVGDAFTSVGGRPQGRIVSLEPPHQLTATILGAYLSYVLVPEGPQATRLLLKVVMQATRFGVAWSVGDLVMARRQLLNLKRLAELESSRGDAGG